MGVKEEQKEETSVTSTCGLAPSRLVGRLVMRVKRRVGSEGWKSIRSLSKATPARPDACRFSSLRRWRKPSVGPVLHARVSPAWTADSSDVADGVQLPAVQ